MTRSGFIGQMTGYRRRSRTQDAWEKIASLLIRLETAKAVNVIVGRSTWVTRDVRVISDATQKPAPRAINPRAKKEPGQYDTTHPRR